MSDDIARFEAAVKHNGDNFAEWAGGKPVSVGDRDIIGGGLYPDGGDWVVYDARGQTGFIGVHHDDWSDIHPVKVKSAKSLGIDLRVKDIPRQVSTIELMHRYRWIADVFLNWLHVDGGSPYLIWDTAQANAQAYDAEVASFADDPHLALYWLMQLGLCCDPRYEDVAQAMRQHGHDESLRQARLALAFFDGTDATHDIDLTPGYNPKGEDYSGLFLRRRANLLYWTYSLSYRGDGAADPIWNSVSISRGQDNYALLRMRWLVNNIKKFDLWDRLGDKVRDPASDTIPFVTYARLFHPTHPAGRDDADALVRELLDTRALWGGRYGNFGKGVLCDIRNLVGDKAALKAAALAIFDGDLANEKLADILLSVGEDAPGNSEAHAKLAEYEALFDGIRSLSMLNTDQKTALFAQADRLLSGLDDDALSFVVEATSSQIARDVLLRHVILTPVTDQEDHIVSLYARAPLKKHDLKHLFETPAQAEPTGPEQPYARALLRVLGLPADRYTADHLRQWAIEAACRALRPIAHMPDGFEPVIQLIEAGTPADLPDLMFEHLFRAERRAKHHPVPQLDTSQITRLTVACLAYVEANPTRFREALRLVRRCTEHNPQLINSPQTAVFQSLLKVLHLPAARFESPMDHADAISQASLAALPQLHAPEVFDALLDVVEAGNRAVFKSGLFSFYMKDAEIMPLLSEAQVTRLLNICVSQLRAYPDDTREAFRGIADCVTPKALPWINRAFTDPAVLAPLKGVTIDFRSGVDEVKDILNDLREDIGAADDN